MNFYQPVMPPLEDLPLHRETDPLTGAAVRSLYGHAAETLRPRPADLDGIDVLVVDLPDIGSRYYTFADEFQAILHRKVHTSEE